MRCKAVDVDSINDHIDEKLMIKLMSAIRGKLTKVIFNKKTKKNHTE